MLYVTQYKANVVTLLLGQIFPSWDIYKISNQQISDETAQEIYIRNKVMLDNSIQNATFVAYQEAGIEITIKDTKNIVYLQKNHVPIREFCKFLFILL